VKGHSGMKYCRQPVKASVQDTLKLYYKPKLYFAFKFIFDCQSSQRLRHWV